MHHLMAKFWWILFIRGLLGVVLGLAAAAWLVTLSQPTVDLFGLNLFFRQAALIASLLLVLGLYAFLDGAFALILGFQDYGDGRRWPSLIVEGILSVGLGVFAWLKPDLAALVLLYWIAAWALFTGLLEIMQGFELNEYRDRRKPFLFAGFISALFGFCILCFHTAGAQLIWLMGTYAFFFGIPLLVLGLHLRRFAHKR